MNLSFDLKLHTGELLWAQHKAVSMDEILFCPESEILKLNGFIKWHNVASRQSDHPIFWTNGIDHKSKFIKTGKGIHAHSYITIIIVVALATDSQTTFGTPIIFTFWCGGENSIGRLRISHMEGVPLAEIKTQTWQGLWPV